MSQQSGAVRRGGSSNPTRRTLDLEEEIINIPDCDISVVAEQFKLTVIGRMFHREERSTEALINLLPKPKIWDMEGRTQGTNLGNGQFQFDFDHEEDMNKILAKRPWHFNRWMFSLEKWEPFTREDFPNTMVFWVVVTGIPVHFWNIPTFTEIGKALETIIKIEAKKAKFQVSIKADSPLQFERKVGFPNGDVGIAHLTYEGLQRYCFTCKLLSHEEGTCPELTEEQREEKKHQRAEQAKQDILTTYPATFLRPANREITDPLKGIGRLPPCQLDDVRSRALVTRTENHRRDSSARNLESYNRSYERRGR
ncbi:unnamed protein product [Microthlaspi erraticum]|uniref:DUF4283 domain-containing protein n=1 Tax=Microthlaspi erraticum TaxID=1685480 RepID=A0A6D2HF44_9BRAS|nr:unnamed protein product [Microthlaspi erraticum]